MRKGTQTSRIMHMPKCGACNQMANLSRQGGAQRPLRRNHRPVLNDGDKVKVINN